MVATAVVEGTLRLVSRKRFPKQAQRSPGNGILALRRLRPLAFHSPILLYFLVCFDGLERDLASTPSNLQGSTLEHPILLFCRPLFDPLDVLNGLAPPLFHVSGKLSHPDVSHTILPPPFPTRPFDRFCRHSLPFQARLFPFQALPFDRVPRRNSRPRRPTLAEARSCADAMATRMTSFESRSWGSRGMASGPRTTHTRLHASISRFQPNYSASFQFMRGVDEPVLPDVRLMRSNRPSEVFAVATLVFENPSLFQDEYYHGDAVIEGLYLVNVLEGGCEDLTSDWYWRSWLREPPGADYLGEAAFVLKCDQDVKATFRNGKPHCVEAKCTLYTALEYKNFVEFMEKYAVERGMGYAIR